MAQLTSFRSTKYVLGQGIQSIQLDSAPSSLSFRRLNVPSAIPAILFQRNSEAFNAIRGSS
jgi:hypothetical protein